MYYTNHEHQSINFEHKYSIFNFIDLITWYIFIIFALNGLNICTNVFRIPEQWRRLLKPIIFCAEIFLWSANIQFINHQTAWWPGRRGQQAIATRTLVVECCAVSQQETTVRIFEDNSTLLFHRNKYTYIILSSISIIYFNFVHRQWFVPILRSCNIID